MNIQEIKKEIKVLEKSETTWQNIERLSWLYSIREHFRPEMKFSKESEFLDICKKADLNSMLEILDEHMEVIKVLHPKEYQSLIERIQQ